MKHTTTLDGIQIEYEPCDHCGKSPENTELEAAVAAAKRELFYSCVICGEKFRIWRLEIYHYKSGDTDKWGSHGTMLEPSLSVSVQGRGGVVSNNVHDRCLRNLVGDRLLPEELKTEIRK